MQTFGEVGQRQQGLPPVALRRAWASWLVLVLAVPLLLLTSAWLLNLAPVKIAVAVDGRNLTVSVDGRTQQVQLAAAVQALRFPAPVPNQREYQIDGSDSTNNFTFDPVYFSHEATTRYYQFQAWLRDDASYSRWQQLAIRNGEGRVVTQQAQPGDDRTIALPQPFRLTVDLHRLEIPRTLELVNTQGPVARIEINRNDRYVRIVAVAPGGAEQELAKRYFPFSWQPPLVEVMYLLLRATALLFAVTAVLVLVATVAPVWRPVVRLSNARLVAGGAAAVVLVASGFGAVVLFAQAPHILDAVSYYSQAKIFAGGNLAAPAPPLRAAFPIPFFVVFRGKWFSQYPPGTPLLLAAGFRVGLPWLVEPLLAAGAALLTFGIARRQFGVPTAVASAILFATSPFLLLQAGTMLSHVPAMAGVTLALYGATRYWEQPQRRWIVLGAAALGFAFLCREIAAVLYGVPLFLFVVLTVRRTHRRLPGDIALAAGCLGIFLVAYLLYNRAQTGTPLLLPRNLFDPNDKFGFGQGVGFYGRHTLGSGLVNADELLTALTITLFGWPFYCALALLAAPFLLRRPQPWEVLHGTVLALYVLVYVGFYYHGIAFGPRYYFEALPSMVILAARGFQAVAYRAGAVLAIWGRPHAAARAHVATLTLFAALLACNLIYFLPRQVTLYRGFTGLPGGGGPVLGSFIHQEAVGRVSSLQQALVTTDNWWTYNVYLAALNCPALNCPTVFAFAPDAPTVQALRAAFPNRTWYRLEEQDGTLQAVRGPG